MSNVSTRFTFRDGKTYLTGYPKWTGVHDLNDPVYSGYDTLYIGPWAPDQERYFIIGPTCATTYSPKLSIYDAYTNTSIDEGILQPGLSVVSLFSWGDYEIARPNDTPDILATLGRLQGMLSADQSAITSKIIPVIEGQIISFRFQDNDYQAINGYRPVMDITKNNPWTPILILPVGPFTGASGYTITGQIQDSGAFVYFNGAKQSGELTIAAKTPILFDYGPRWHYTEHVATGEHLYDTCYHFRTVNLSSTPT